MPITSTPASTVTFVSPVQPSNAPIGIRLSDAGIVKDVRFVQSNALSPIATRTSGNETAANFSQYPNASCPMFVTPEGMFTA